MSDYCWYLLTVTCINPDTGFQQEEGTGHLLLEEAQRLARIYKGSSLPCSIWQVNAEGERIKQL